MTGEAEAQIAALVDGAEEIQDEVIQGVEHSKPRLLIENCDPHRTVVALRNILTKAGDLYDRGVPVRLAFDQVQGGTVAQVMTPDILVLIAHTVSRPFILKEKKTVQSSKKMHGFRAHMPSCI